MRSRQIARHDVAFVPDEDLGALRRLEDVVHHGARHFSEELVALFRVGEAWALRCAILLVRGY